MSRRGIPLTRICIAAVASLLVYTPAAGDSVVPAFIDMCKTEVKGDVKDKLGLRSLKIDPAGFCVCVALSLDRIVSDNELAALVGKPLPEAFLTKLEMAEGLCAVLIVGAAGKD